MSKLWPTAMVALVAAVLAFPLSGSLSQADAQTVEAPQLLVGDRWERSNKWSYEVIGEKDGYYRIKANDGKDSFEILWQKSTLTWTHTQRKGKGPTLFPLSEPPQVWLAFPLEIGKKWAYDYQYTFSDYPHYHSNSVEGWEDVVVPAGRFRALKIRSDIRVTSTTGKGVGYFTETYWYAPAVRNLVKGTSDIGGPWRNRLFNFELIGFSPGKEQ